MQTQGLLFAAYTRNDMAKVGDFSIIVGATHVTAVKILNKLVEKNEFIKHKRQMIDV